MKKQWRLKTGSVSNIFEGIVSELTTTILINRGVKDIETITTIVQPDYDEHLHDPFLLTDMAKAVKRIIEAINNQQLIMIFGDYDADGVPAAAILAEFLKKIGYNYYDVYIPHRHNEQYGLSLKLIEKFEKQKINLIITVDCGISNMAEITRANELGIDVIVTDHHLPPAKLPPALAIINPKRLDDDYPYKFLAGAGVAFKLVQGLVKSGHFMMIEPGWEKNLLDLVAIATVADMVPITGENKTLVKFGLIILKMTKRIGLLELFRVLKLKQKFLTEDDIGFMIGPRLNSAGRMSHASQAFLLLVTDKEEEARTIVAHLEEKNKERRSLVTSILLTAKELLDDKKIPPVVVIGNPDWSLGVLGLAAARLAESLSRSVFVWAQNGNGEIKGSCRSDGKVNVVELMAVANQDGFFSDYGGHAFAGGFSLTSDNIKDLSIKLNEAYKKAPKTEVIEEEDVDCQLSLDDITWPLQKELDKLGPYGLDFPKPVFWLSNLIILTAKSFGKEGGHVELKFTKTSGEIVTAIAFFACEGQLNFDQGHIWPGVNLTPGRQLDILVNIEKSTFKYRPELRLRIVDLRQSI